MRSRSLPALVLVAISAGACASPTSPLPPGERLPTVGVECPADANSTETNFHPRPARDGVLYDIEVPDGWTGARVVRAGDLAIPSGRLIAASGGEMAYLMELRAVDLGVDGGSYPVNLLIARFDSGDRRVAFAEIVLRDDSVVRWAGSAALSFGTDGGDGGYISAEASRYAGTGDGQWLFERASIPSIPARPLAQLGGAAMDFTTGSEDYRCVRAAEKARPQPQAQPEVRTLLDSPLRDTRQPTQRIEGDRCDEPLQGSDDDLLVDELAYEPEGDAEQAKDRPDQGDHPLPKPMRRPCTLVRLYPSRSPSEVRPDEAVFGHGSSTSLPSRAGSYSSGNVPP
jgi:hypothetical protein